MARLIPPCYSVRMMKGTVAVLIVAAHLPWTTSSDGCGLPPPVGAGQTGEASFVFDGVSRQFFYHVPAGYNQDSEVPLVLAFHGWGGDGGEVINNGIAAEADVSSFVVVAPTGLGEEDSPDGEENPNSWNGGGTSESPSQVAGPTCDPEAGAEGTCYSPSCDASGCDECDWTTCFNDVGFVNQLLDWVEQRLCIDPARIYATGYSNGGQFVWQLGAQLSDRLAAVLPVMGTPHPGFALAPPTPQSVMVVHGTEDDVCPANSTDPSVDGWFYNTVPTPS